MDTLLSMLPLCMYINMFKDPVCGMMVDEKNAQYISEIGEKRYTFAVLPVRVNLTKIQANMDTSALLT